MPNLARVIDLVSPWAFLEGPHTEPAILRDVRSLLVETVHAHW